MEQTSKRIQISQNGQFEVVSKTAIKNRLRRKKTTEKKRKVRQENIRHQDLNEILQLEEIAIQVKPNDQRIISQAVESANLVECNKLISNYGQAKKLSLSLLVFRRMAEQNIFPSVYTLTSLVNSCVRCGEIDRAREFIKQFEKIIIFPNEVTYTALIKGFCQEGMMNEAISTKEKMQKAKIAPNLRTYNTILRGCLRNGQSDLALQIFNEISAANLIPDVSSYEYLIKSLCLNFRVDEAWEHAMQLKQQGISQPSVFSAIATAASLSDNRKLGLKATKMAIEALKSNDVNTQGKMQRDSADLFMRLKKEEVEKELKRIEFISPVCCFTDAVIEVNKLEILRRLNFRKRFKNSNPIKMEVCSGHGEWVVERASQDTNVNWIAIEMRFERVFQIWSKASQKGLSNLIILCGEACQTLKKCIKRERLDEIFVNYPDPPVWELSKWLLINGEFLNEVYRVLEQKRSITIVTDNRGYANTMIQEFSKLSDLFRPEFEGLNMRVPEGYGSSYFDRFWLNGNKAERFLLKYNKE